MISFRHSCHILDMLNSLPIFPLTILCGNNRQLKAFAKQDSHTRTVRNLFDNHLLLSFCRSTVLTEQMRCTDLQYSRLLQTVHHLTLSNHDVRRHFLKLLQFAIFTRKSHRMTLYGAFGNVSKPLS